MSALKPYNISNLIVGSARVLVAPTTQAVPANIADIVAMTAPYAPLGTWRDLGAAADSTTYARDMDSEGLEIQQETGAIMEEITDVERTLEFDVAEIEENNLKLIENAPAINTIAAAAGKGAQKGVPVGSFSDLAQYRFAMIGVRKQQSGLVTEPGGATRGRLLAMALYRAEVTADKVEIEFDKGNIAHGKVTVKSFPESGQPSGQDYGVWLSEQAGTIT